MWRVALLLAGCNSIFGIKDTRQYDAAYFDAPPDAPFTCPAQAGTAPAFSPSLHQDVIQSCSTYRERGGVVVAQCTDQTTFQIQNLVGALHQPLTTAAGLPQTDYSMFQYYDELYPGTGGQHIYLRHGDNGVYTYEEWSPGADGQWAFTRALPIKGYAPLYDAFADRVLIGDSTSVAFDEDTLDGTLMFKHTADEMGLVGIVSWDVSSDGLRAFVSGASATSNNTDSVYYTDRAALDTAFSPVRRIANVPNVSAITAADDCSRLYFPALGSIFYLQQD